MLRIYKSKTLVKHISFNCKCKFSGTTCISNHKWNNHTRQWKCKKYHTWKKDYILNPSTCIRENRKYLKIIVHTSVIVCDENINVIESV